MHVRNAEVQAYVSMVGKRCDVWSVEVLVFVSTVGLRSSALHVEDL